MNIHQQFSWTDDAVAEAAEMWNDGRTLTEIADFLGTSRHSVGGLTHRRRDLFPTRKVVVTTKPSAERLAKPTIAFDFSGYCLPDVQPISFVALGRGECRWPLSCDNGDGGPDMPCCGAETGGMVYCPPHASISRGRGTESERTALKSLRRFA